MLNAIKAICASKRASGWPGIRRPIANEAAKPKAEVAKAGIARTFQNIRLFKSLTALDNVKVACLAETHPLFSRARVESLQRTGLRPLATALDAANDYYDWWSALLLTPGFQAEEEAKAEKPRHHPHTLLSRFVRPPAAQNPHPSLLPGPPCGRKPAWGGLTPTRRARAPSGWPPPPPRKRPPAPPGPRGRGGRGWWFPPGSPPRP